MASAIRLLANIAEQWFNDLLMLEEIRCRSQTVLILEGVDLKSLRKSLYGDEKYINVAKQTKLRHFFFFFSSS